MPDGKKRFNHEFHEWARMNLPGGKWFFSKMNTGYDLKNDPQIHTDATQIIRRNDKIPFLPLSLIRPGLVILLLSLRQMTPEGSRANVDGCFKDR